MNKPGPSPTGTRQGGFALLLVLWTMVLLSVIGAHIAATGRTETQLAANIRDAAVTESAADGAIQDAAFQVLTAPSWTPGGTERSVSFEAAAVDLRIESEDSFVNPNVASRELLSALIRQAGSDVQTADQLAAAIVEWRFPGAGAPDGPIGRSYRNAGLVDVPPGAPFRSLDELKAVRGMRPDLLAGLRPYLSVYTTGDPDVQDASPAVLAAIRTATGRAPAPSRSVSMPRVVRVTATAAGPNHSRFVRRAVLAINRQGAAPISVLDWSAPGE